MSLSKEEREIIVNLEIEKAGKTFQQIETLRDAGYWDTIANRLYYAAFHAVSALLIGNGHSVNTHRGVVALFGQHYIRTGIIPLEFGKLYSQLQTMREESDYNCSYNITQDDIEPKIEPTFLLIKKIRQLLADKSAML